MSTESFLDPLALYQNLSISNWVVLDCRFSLQDPDQGRQAFLAGHVPGALYVDLDQDLSGEIIPGKTGRHPFPTPEVFAARLGSWGIDDQTQVVAYDDRGGAIAARIWGMLRWLGHRQVAVLEGGWSAWKDAGYPVTREVIKPRQKEFLPDLQQDLIVGADFISQILDREDYLLVDARSHERYLGLTEPIDPVAGHIPGAVSLPYEENLNQANRLIPDTALIEKLEKKLKGYPADQVIFYCGSGVTSLHHLVVLHHLGKPLGRVYSGSWSDWINDPERPIAAGNKAESSPTGKSSS